MTICKREERTNESGRIVRKREEKISSRNLFLSPLPNLCILVERCYAMLLSDVRYSNSVTQTPFLPDFTEREKNEEKNPIFGAISKESLR